MRKKIILLSAVMIFIVLYNIQISAKKIKFQLKTPDVGQEWKEYDFMDIKVNIIAKLNGEELGKFNSIETTTSIKHIEVLDSNEEKINKIKAFYEKSESYKKDDDGESTEKDIIAGKTYIINNTDELSITYEKDEIPPQEEIDYLKEEYNDSTLYEDVKELNGKEIKMNTDLSFIEDIFFETFFDSMDVKQNNDSKNNIKVKYKGTKQYNNLECGVFDILFNITLPIEENINMNLNLKGELFVSVNESWLVRIAFKGPLTISGKSDIDQGELIMEGDGTAEFEYDISYK